MKTKSLILSVLLALALLVSCAKAPEKQKFIWICTDNLPTFCAKDSVDFYLDKIRETGFNNIVLDLNGVAGIYVWDLPGRDWDYAGYFIEQAHKRGLKVTLSMCTFAIGDTNWQTGPVYDNPELKDMTCRMYTPQGWFKIEDSRTYDVAAFTNPAMPEAREYAKDGYRKVLTRYKFDGIALDYCRYGGFGSDFSEFSRHAFEEWLGEKVGNFPEDIFVWAKDGSQIPGKYYKQWIEWRTRNITSFIAEMRELIDEVQPGVKLYYWAASWIWDLQKNGQNWTSPRTDYFKQFPWATENYGETGFAPYLDAFFAGAYLEVIYGPEDKWSVEHHLQVAKELTMGDCGVVGSIYAANHKGEFDDAVYVCMRDTEGVVVFDFIQVKNYNLWDTIKRGIDRAESELK